MKTTKGRFTVLVCWVLMVGSTAPARSELKDEQVGHLIFMKTDCRLLKLSWTDNDDGSRAYTGTCQNVTYYPDGIRVTCPDPDNDDERTCTIHTKPKSFDYLDLLRR